MSDQFSISGKVAVVTGGTRGIGEMIATGFIQAGVRTYITSRNADACSSMQEKLSAFGECFAYPSDLSSNVGIENFVSWLSEREDHVDILVNNAGATWGEPLETFPEDGWDRVMDLNLKSLFFLTQRLLPLLRNAVEANGRGRVINIGSIEGLKLPMLDDSFAYPASKAAVHHLTRAMARTLAKNQITVNAIAPGPFESKMMAFALGHEKGRKAIGSQVPLGRIGRPSDMIGLSRFLASPAADYITGTTIPLDGGYVETR